MKNVLSPMTDLPNVEKVRDIDIKELISGYKRSFGIDVSEYFKEGQLSVYRCLDSNLLYYFPRKLAGDGLFYERLSKNEWYYEENKWEFEEALKYVNTNHRVLEIGSGKGAFLAKASKIAKEAIGLELNSNAVKDARAKGLNVEQKAVQDYMGVNGQFDVVCSFQVMEHVEDVKGIIDASVNLLAKDGILIISVPNNSAYLKNLGAAWLNMPPHHLNLWTEESLSNLPKFFEIQLKDVLFDDLEEKHVSGFYASISSEIQKSRIKRVFFNKIFGKKIKLGISNIRNSIKGHTIMAIYSKN